MSIFKSKMLVFTVHIDPEDDEFASPCTHLPLRDEILRRLEAQWQSLEMTTTMMALEKMMTTAWI